MDTPPERLRPPVGLQNLLLGLGTALVAIALVVFTAVNWSRMDASVQGLILVAFTGLTAAGAAAAAGRVNRGRGVSDCGRDPGHRVSALGRIA